MATSLSLTNPITFVVDSELLIGTISINLIRLPWFRVHIVVLNDPGRLISVHIMHTGILASWSALYILYELIIFDSTDPRYNPCWRQGCYVIPFISRLGSTTSLYNWSLGIKLSRSVWTYETMNVAHLLFSGLLILAAFWHWAYLDLDIFVSVKTSQLLLDLNKILGIHLMVASVVCFGFGYGHLSGAHGPGMWSSDSKGLKGCVRMVKPIYGLIGSTYLAFCYALMPRHHIISGFTGILIALWHIEVTPGSILYKLNKMSNLESVLSSSISSVFFTAFMNSSLFWYGTVSAALELFGPNRYHWDNGYFSQDIESRVSSINSIFLNKAWEQVPDKLVLYDYIGYNPSKAGLFRSGPILKGDGLVINWLGHITFEIGTLSLAIVRSPAFFETFPVILIDKGGTLRADIGFRRAESLNSIDTKEVLLYFHGGIYHGLEYSTASVVKDYARKAQFGEIFTFDFKTTRANGVFRTSPRGWYSFSHTVLAELFFFGHLWHATRAIFRSLWTGLTIPSL